MLHQKWTAIGGGSRSSIGAQVFCCGATCRARLTCLMMALEFAVVGILKPIRSSCFTYIRSAGIPSSRTPAGAVSNCSKKCKMRWKRAHSLKCHLVTWHDPYYSRCRAGLTWPVKQNMKALTSAIQSPIGDTKSNLSIQCRRNFHPNVFEFCTGAAHGREKLHKPNVLIIESCEVFFSI